MKNKRAYVAKDQRGLVSLIVTVIIMLVLTITVVSYASLMRREQRQTLDRQLNTQAFYASESGVSDAVAKLNSYGPGDPHLSVNYTECTGGGPNDFVAQTGLNSTINSTTKVSYSCLLVNPKPTSLEYGNIDDTPRIIPIVTPTGNIKTITMNWQAKDGSSGFSCASYPDLPPANTWTGACPTGLLRLDVVKVSNNFQRDDLNRDLRTYFLYPQSTASTSPSGPFAPGANTGQIIQANCNTAEMPKYCGASIDVSAFSSGQFYMRLSSLYSASAVTIQAFTAASPLPVELTGAQAVIDSTGKSNDILRRVQARVSLNPLGKGPFPGTAIQSADSICKLFFTIPPSTVGIDPSGAANPACQLN